MSDKTEPPTPKRLRDARKKGQVAHSKEAVSAALTIGLFGYLWTAWDSYLDRFQELFWIPPQFYTMPFRDAAHFMLDRVLELLLAMVAPVVAIAVLIAIAANFAQVGVLFAAESIMPKLDKLNPAKGIKKIFSVKSLIELAKSIVKVVFLSILLIILIKDGVGPLIRAPACGFGCIEFVLSELLKQLVIYTSAAFIIVAAADVFLQRHQHTKQLMMSKDEVKREYKEMEGDPHIKGKRKQLHHELVMNDMVQSTRKASVVVTNPTHIAVALRYEPGETPLPVIVAKGENLLAQRIVQIAQQEGIPIMENVPLARALYDQAEVDRYIPSDLIEPVAEVLRWIRQLRAADAEPPAA